MYQGFCQVHLLIWLEKGEAGSCAPSSPGPPTPVNKVLNLLREIHVNDIPHKFKINTPSSQISCKQNFNLLLLEQSNVFLPCLLVHFPINA